jgi:hypothetical protein
VARATLLSRALRVALADDGFMPGGGQLGFHCRHQYEESALSQVWLSGEARGSCRT